MPKVSVIIPVYGVEQYIEDCVQSLLAQTLDDIQFILVDDHGTDRSIEIAHNVVDCHDRKNQFLFLDPEHNLGAGMARNYALPYANGEYVAFLDSDDTISPTTYEEMYATAKANDADLCCCQMQQYYTDGSMGKIIANPYVDGVTLTDERRAHVLTNYVSCFTTFLFRRSLLQEADIKFPPEHLAEDSFFVSCAWMMAKSVVYVNKPFYHYLVRPGSLTTHKDPQKWQQRYTVFSKLMDYARHQGVFDQYASELEFMFYKKAYLSSIVSYSTNSTHISRRIMREIRQQILNVFPNYQQNNYIKGNLALRLLDRILQYLPCIGGHLIRIYAQRKQLYT